MARLTTILWQLEQRGETFQAMGKIASLVSIYPSMCRKPETRKGTSVNTDDASMICIPLAANSEATHHHSTPIIHPMNGKQDKTISEQVSSHKRNG